MLSCELDDFKPNSNKLLEIFAGMSHFRIKKFLKEIKFLAKHSFYFIFLPGFKSKDRIKNNSSRILIFKKLTDSSHKILAVR